MTGQVGHHHERSTEHSNEQDLLAGIVLRDLPANLPELVIDLLGCDQGLDVHPLTSLAKIET